MNFAGSVKYYFLVIFMLCGLVGFPINDQTLYFMNQLPLNHTVNPTYQTSENFLYIGLPLLSSGHVNYEYSRGIMNAGNIKKIADRLSDYEIFGVSASHRYIDLGLQIKDFYFTIGAESKFVGGINVYKDAVKLMLIGDSAFLSDPVINLEKSHIQEYNYQEISVGVSKYFKDWNLTLGGKLKYLIGQHHASVQFDPISRWEGTNHQIAGQFAVTGTVASAVEPTYTTLEDVDFKNQYFGKSFAYFTSLFSVVPTQGHGLAIDFGASVTLLESKKLTFSISFLDLGFIYWNNARKIITETPYIVGETSQLQDKDPSFNLNYLHSYLQKIPIVEEKQSSFMRLAGRLYVGGSYCLTSKLNIGALFGLSSYTGIRYDPSATFSLNTQNLPINISTSYTLKNNRYGNLGIGLQIGDRGIQFHFIAENLIQLGMALFSKSSVLPTNMITQHMYFRAGVNLLLNLKPQQRRESPRRCNCQILND